MNRIVRGTLMSLGLVTALAAGVAASPAQAETYYNHYGNQGYSAPGYAVPHVAYPVPVLNDWQIERRLRRQGFDTTGPIIRGNGYVHVRAVDYSGRHVRLTVSPVTGQVIGARYRW